MLKKVPLRSFFKVFGQNVFAREMINLVSCELVVGIIKEIYTTLISIIVFHELNTDGEFCT